MTADQEMPKLQAYTRHIVSYQLEANHPYLDDIRSHLGKHEVSTAFGSRQFPRLHELITSSTIEPKELVEALETITALVSNQEYKVLAVDADTFGNGICSAVSDLMLHKNVHVQRSAVKTLSRLALVLKGRETLRDCEAADRLADLLLAAEDEQVQANVADAMACCAIATDGCQYLVDRGCVHAIGSHLLGSLPKPTSKTIGSCAVGLLETLRHVTVTANLGVRDLIGQGVVAKITAFIDTLNGSMISTIDPSVAPKVLENALAVLGAVNADPAGRKELVSCGGVEVLAKFCKVDKSSNPMQYTHRAEYPAVREKAIATLLMLAMEVDGKKRLVACVEDIAGLVANPPEGSTAYSKDVSGRLCLCAAELPAFRLELARALVFLDPKVHYALFGVTVVREYALLLESTKKLSMKSSIMSAMKDVVCADKKPPIGDEIYVPLMKPEHKSSPAEYAVETCPAIIDRLFTLALCRPGVDPASTALPTQILEALAKTPLGKKELLRVSKAKPPQSDKEVLPSLKKVLDSVSA
jgi:hypothetical protein